MIYRHDCICIQQFTFYSLTFYSCKHFQNFWIFNSVVSIMLCKFHCFDTASPDLPMGNWNLITMVSPLLSPLSRGKTLGSCRGMFQTYKLVKWYLRTVTSEYVYLFITKEEILLPLNCLKNFLELTKETFQRNPFTLLRLGTVLVITTVQRN